MSLYTLEKIRVRHILKNIVPRGLDARIEEIEERHQKAIKKKIIKYRPLSLQMKNINRKFWSSIKRLMIS